MTALCSTCCICWWINKIRYNGFMLKLLTICQPIVCCPLYKWCECDISGWIVLRFGTHIGSDSVLSWLNFQGHESKVKFTDWLWYKWYAWLRIQGISVALIGSAFSLQFCMNGVFLMGHTVGHITQQAFRNYRKTSSISRTKSQNLNVSRIPLQLSSLNPLKPGVKLRMKM